MNEWLNCKKWTK